MLAAIDLPHIINLGTGKLMRRHVCVTGYQAISGAAKPAPVPVAGCPSWGDGLCG